MNELTDSVAMDPMQQIERLIDKCDFPAENVAMLCLRMKPALAWRVFAEHRVDCKALMPTGFRHYFVHAEKDEPIFPQLFQHYLDDIPGDAIPCLLQHLQSGFSADDVVDLLVPGKRVTSEAVTRFLLQEGWSTFSHLEGNSSLLFLPALQNCVRELSDTQRWLSSELINETGLIKVLAELVFSYLPWWSSFTAYHKALDSKRGTPNRAPTSTSATHAAVSARAEAAAASTSIDFVDASPLELPELEPVITAVLR